VLNQAAGGWDAAPPSSPRAGRRGTPPLTLATNRFPRTTSGEPRATTGTATAAWDYEEFARLVAPEVAAVRCLLSQPTERR
jgi:hypothetical protein